MKDLQLPAFFLTLATLPYVINRCNQLLLKPGIEPIVYIFHGVPTKELKWCSCFYFRSASSIQPTSAFTGWNHSLLLYHVSIFLQTLSVFSFFKHFVFKFIRRRYTLLNPTFNLSLASYNVKHIWISNVLSEFFSALLSELALYTLA